MTTQEELKQLVKEKYSQIANQKLKVNLASCCGTGDISKEVYILQTG